MAAITSRSGGLNRQVWLRALAAPVFLFALLFLSAGRIDYWQAWLYIGLSLATMATNVVVLRDNRDLIEERLRPGEGMKRWDRTFFALSVPIYLGFLIVAGLDAGRFGWTQLPGWSYVVSVAIWVLGQAIFLWAKRTNRFFSSVVRIQTDRGQTVCREGPYRTVRHPGYSGSLLYTLSAPLVLGSLWALVPSVLAVGLLVWRTGLEDRTLQAELPGYAEYAREVRYRLLPGIW